MVLVILQVRLVLSSGQAHSLYITNLRECDFFDIKMGLNYAFTQKTNISRHDFGVDMSKVVGYTVEKVKEKKGWFS
jgi:hypothetical protein